MKCRLQISTSIKKSATIIKHAFSTQPFKIVSLKESGSNTFLNLVIMSSSPGIMDGDQYDWQISMGEHTCLQLETQSFQRLFQMKKGASQSFQVWMDKGSSFIYLPHPVVPHLHANFLSDNKFYLSENCNLVVSEIVACGRKLCGESFAYSRYHATTDIYLNGTLVIKENVLLVPSHGNLMGMGQMEECSHQGSLLCVSSKRMDPLVILQIRSLLEKETDLIYGISELPVNGMIVRLLGNKAEQLFTCIKNIGAVLSDQIKPFAFKTVVA